MKFGICLFNWEPFVYKPKIYEELAIEAESNGFDTVFVTDHFLRPHASGDVPPRQHATLEAWTLLSNIAAKTRTIRLGTCVTPIPLRRPEILAKMVATVDILSEGRVILGAGAGWDRPEFEAYGQWHSNRERVQMTREGVELLRKLWSEDVVSYDGLFFKSRNVILEPKPVQRGGPPIWVGAIHDKMLDLTAELGDAWFPGRGVGATLEHYGHGVTRIKERSETIGRKELPYLSLMGYFTEVGAPSTLPAIGSLNDAIELVGKYKELGCEHLAVTFFPISKFKEMMKRFVRDLMPVFA